MFVVLTGLAQSLKKNRHDREGRKVVILIMDPRRALLIGAHRGGVFGLQWERMIGKILRPLLVCGRKQARYRCSREGVSRTCQIVRYI